MSADLSADDARLLALHAQGLSAQAPKPRSVRDLLGRLGAIQLDTISVLARSHEIVPCSRLGCVDREEVAHAYWGRPSRAFEYWAHEACVLPIDAWPWFEFRRRRWREHYRANPRLASEKRAVLVRLRDRGPSTAAELGSSGRTGPWWDWHPIKIAVEILLRTGEVTCVARRGWRRIYSLAETAVPARLRRRQPSDRECLIHLSTEAGRRLGVATLRDLADYYRLKPAHLRDIMADTPLVPVRVDGWKEPAWADPVALRKRRLQPRATPVLLSPFDSLIWDRRRTERLFGFRYRIECYVPAAKRVHGYYSMPLLSDGRLVGRVDPKREGTTLLARSVRVDRGAEAAMAKALRDAATWVGCTSVQVRGAPGVRQLV